ncbi:uncharacterized protein F4807DRAFT_466886 [Annulohypoxylon truncatum]|uniref:uncharacterized protein n=1 Tax=Annulohypoxylon truncatum TaxID=327061 RepID=UPI002007AE2D|nr:uncharacterized protein F4807DRAFT_466886 [Annulohypoxylon truncatum]KAI1211083.1 hypothetical protein F4807DRAFT_466886 [Annulohypoxylon truncatum]
MAGRKFPNNFNAHPNIPGKRTIRYDEYETYNPEPRYNPMTTQPANIQHNSPGNAELTAKTAPLTERNLAIQRAVQRAAHWRETQLAQQQSGQAGTQPTEPMRHADYVAYMNNQGRFPTEPDSISFNFAPNNPNSLTSYTNTTNSGTAESEGSDTVVDPNVSRSISSDVSNSAGGSSISSETSIDPLLYNRALWDLLRAEEAYKASRARAIASGVVVQGGIPGPDTHGTSTSGYTTGSERPQFKTVVWGERTDVPPDDESLISPHTQKRYLPKRS